MNDRVKVLLAMLLLPVVQKSKVCYIHYLNHGQGSVFLGLDIMFLYRIGNAFAFYFLAQYGKKHK